MVNVHQAAAVPGGPGRALGTAGRRRKNAVVVAVLLGILAGMGTLVYFAVPLYQLFCQVTGFGGTTRVATAAPEAAGAAAITVRFDANVAPDLPWKFVAPKPVTLPLGEERLVAFEATNLGDEPVLGTATFNVTPFKTGEYFNKIECFCFTEQLLMPGESKEFPVTFFVDPAIVDDASAAEVSAITLSYTFFNKGEAARDEYLRTHQVETAASKRAE
ncbi:MAG: cytochrome c oxidase assembly protein [Geminicoccaceae bacterium]